jgi:hypothetical protein
VCVLHSFPPSSLSGWGFSFLAAYVSSYRVLGMEGFPGRNCVYIVVNVCLGLFPAHQGRGSGVQVQHDASLWVVYNIGRSYAFFYSLIFLRDHTGTWFLARNGVLFSSSLLNLIWVLGQRDQFGKQANIKRVLGV